MNTSAKREAAIDLHLVPLAVSPECEQQCREVLSEEEITRADRYKVETARAEFVVSHAAMRCLLAGYIDCDPSELEYDFGVHGKPVVKSPKDRTDYQFNLSHSRGLGAIAVTPMGRVGVDIEGNRTLDSPESLSKSILAEQELEEYTNLPLAQKGTYLLRCWTLKEAFLKAVGVGLSVNASKVVLADTMSVSPRLQTTGITSERVESWHLTFPITNDGFTLAIATDNLTSDMNVIEHEVRPWNSAVKSSKNT